MRTRLVAAATAAFLLFPLTASASAMMKKCDEKGGVAHKCDGPSRR